MPKIASARPAKKPFFLAGPAGFGAGAGAGAGAEPLPEEAPAGAATTVQLIADPAATGNTGQIDAILRGRPEGFGVLSGDDGLTLRRRSTIPGIAPRDDVAFFYVCLVALVLVALFRVYSF